MNADTQQDGLISKNGVSLLVPLLLVTSCFALWGFANDITNPMVKAFSKIFRMNVTDGALVQVAFYGGYFAMAFPAALFLRRYSYKAGVMLGLGLYALGAFLFYPAALTGSYYPFLLAYFVLTCGLAFLETSCNPYVLSMGSEATATRRLNLVQSFNPVGSLCGMYVAMNFIQGRLNPMDTAQRALLGEEEFAAVRDSDLQVLIGPYLWIGAFITAMFLLIGFRNMPDTRSQVSAQENKIACTLRRLWHRKCYREGVLTQFFYVGAQIMCWTFIIQYGTRIFMSEGLGEQEAEMLAQRFNMVAMVLFCASRFFCTFLLKYLDSARLLLFFALTAALLTVGVIVCQDRTGMYCLVGVSACMSLMFPTIYGIALEGMGEDAKLGAAGLIMAILGGSLLPPLQATIIDQHTVWGLPAEHLSFALPLLCFVVIAIFSFRVLRRMLRNA